MNGGFAANYTSTGSGNWDSPLTWSPNGVPVSGDNVQINGHTVTHAGDLNWASGTISGNINLVVEGNFSMTGGAWSMWSTFNLQVIGDYTYNQGDINLNSGHSLDVGGNLTITSGKIANSGTVPISIGGNLTVSGNIETNSGPIIVGLNASSTNGKIQTNNGHAISIGGALSVLGDMTANNGDITIGSSATSLAGKIEINNGSEVNINGDLSVASGIEINSGTLSVKGSCSSASVAVNNNSSLFVNEDLVVSNSIQMNSGVIDVNGSVTTSSITLNNTSVFAIDGDLIKNGTVTINSGSSNLVVAGDFISNGGSTNIYNNGGFYVFQILDETGVQAGCLDDCFPHDVCESCQIKSYAEWLADGSPGSSYVMPQSVMLYNSGTFTVPEGVTSIKVECWGGGGGGGSTNGNGQYLGGGGGGAYAASILSVTPGTSYNFVVGAGGGGGMAGTNSTFNTSSVIAAGGSGVSPGSATGGIGGAIAGSAGTTKYSGGNGGNGNNPNSGGGGGGAGSSGSGGNASGINGGTSTTLFGGSGGNGLSSNGNGSPGVLYGGGGSGARRSGGPNRTGGSGAQGLIIITWETSDACIDPVTFSVTGGGNYCSGGTGVAVGLDGSETGVDYQLHRDGGAVGPAVGGTGSAIDFGNQTTAGTYTVEATRTDGGCTATMAGNAIVSIDTVLPASVAISADPGYVICAGNIVTFTATPTNGGTSPTYQWKKNGANVASDNPVYIDSDFQDGDQITVVMTSNAPCVSGSPAISNTISMDISPVSPVSVNITSEPAGAVCEGTSVTYTATPTNGGSNPAYQWKVNGTNVGGNSNQYTYTPSNGDQVSCVLSSDADCAEGTATVPILYFSWDDDSKELTDSDFGTDAILINDGQYKTGGVDGTTCLAPVLQNANINLTFDGNNPEFNSAGIDYSIAYRRDESQSQMFTRGNSLVITAGSNFSVSYRVNDGTGSYTTVASGNVYSIPTDGNFHNYRFLYDPTDGYGRLYVDDAQVWISSAATPGLPMYWTGAGNVVVGVETDASGNQTPTFDNLMMNAVSLKTATDLVTVAVGDNTDPTAICQDITVALDASGNASITHGDINNGSSDNCTGSGDLELSLDITSFTCADIGDNVVTLTVTDGAGNSSSCPATVTITGGASPSLDNPASVVCENQTETYTLTETYDSYVWTIAGGSVVAGGSSSDNLVTVNWDNGTSGSVSVVVDLGGCTGGISQNVVFVQEPLFEASNDTTICKGGTATLNIDLGEEAMVFSGSNQWIDIPNSSSINTSPVTERTIALWFKANNVTNRQVLYEEGGNTHGISIFIENGYVYVHAWESGISYAGSYASTPRHTIETGNWHHVAFVMDSDEPNGDYIKGYFDGIYMGSMTDTRAGGAGLPSHSGDVNIAMSDNIRFPDNSSGSGNYFNGYIDEFKLWNSPLPAEDVQAQMFHVSSGASGPNMILYYNFNNDSGNTIENSAQGSLNGTNRNASHDQDTPFTPIVTWSPGGMSGTSVDVSPTETTAYTYTLTEPNNSCQTQGDITVTVTEITLSVSLAHASCDGDDDGVIDLTVSGGTGPYSFAWASTDGNGLVPADEDQTGLSPGTYEVIVTDDNGCTATGSYIVDILNDVTPPTITTCPPPSTFDCVKNLPNVGTPENFGYADFVMLGGEAIDNCSTTEELSFSYQDVTDPTSGCKVTRTYTVTDAANNTATCEQVFTITDDTPPQINCTDIETATNDGCAATFMVEAPAVSDFCSFGDVEPAFSYRLGNDAGNPEQTGEGDITASFPLGTTTISWTYADECGNSNSCEQDIVVVFPLTAVDYDDGSASTTIGSGVKPMQTSTHTYFVDSKTPESGYGYAWGLYENDGGNPGNAVDASYFTINATGDYNQANVAVTFSEDIPTTEYLLSVIKTKNPGSCEKTELLPLTIQANTFDVELLPFGNHCQAGETGTPSAILWEIRFPEVVTEPFQFEYNITLNGSPICSGTVSGISYSSATVTHDSGCLVGAPVVPPYAQVTKTAGSRTVMLEYTISSTTGVDQQIGLNIDATDVYEVSDPDILNNTETLDAWGVPNTSDITTE